MSTAVSGHSGAGPLSLMSCVRESSPPQDTGSEYEPEKNVSTKKKFWNPRKWFKRKSNKVVEEAPNSLTETNQTLRSRSTSELSVAEDQTRRRSGTPMHPGLSVSHDSVFHSPHSGSELELEAAQSSSSLSISHQPTQPDIRLQTELIERLRQRRGDTSEDDEGLPHSPCNSPTTTEGHLEKSHHKDLPTKSHSTCSDGSLLSMGSSEMDEDSFDPPTQSRHASKLSLQEKNKDVPDADITEWGPMNSSFPLNHAAAHHKVSIRPKRTHGGPRRKRTPVVLPTTPEVNEDSSIRSMTPDGTRAGPGMIDSKLTRSRSNAGTQQGESFAEEEEYSDQKSKESSFFGRFFPRRSGKKKKMKEEQEFMPPAKPEVLNTPTSTPANYYKVNVTESTTVTYDPFDQNVITVDSNLAIRPNALRSGPASRQRILPIDIPSTPEFHQRRDRNEELNNSPLMDDMEWYQKHSSMSTNMSMSMNTSITEASSPVKSSPPKSPLMFSMSPPKSPWSEKRTPKKPSKFVEHTTTTSTTESKSIVRIAGLSPLQQRVISLNDDTDTGFKSLTNFPSDFEEKPIKPVTKSHSFKSTSNVKPSVTDLKNSGFKSLEEKSIFKSLSLDSVKNVDDVLGDEGDTLINRDMEHVQQYNENLLQTKQSSENRNDITITGPSHKAIVNIPANELLSQLDSEKVVTTKEMSVTKVQLNRETSATSQVSTVVMKSEYNMTPNRLSNSHKINRQSIDLDLNLEPVVAVRKFSNDNIEVIKKEDIIEKVEKKDEKEVVATPTKTNSIVTVTSMTNASHYRKNESIKRDSKPIIRTKSNSFDSVESRSSTPKSSQSSLDKLDMISNSKSQENIKSASDSVVRRRSLVKQKHDEEPELMKVFARRSLKLKDSDCEALQQQVAKHIENSEKSSAESVENGKSRDSDKENLSDSSPVEERKKPTIAPKSTALLESKMKIDGLDVKLRKPIGNKIAAFQNRPVTTTPMSKPSTVLKPNALPTRPKTEKFQIITPTITMEEKKDIEVNNSNMINTAEIISNISEKTDLIQDSGNVEVKNFRLRKAEWEKRAQESIRKTTP
ncbi:uncharacterized protein [Atheta coriaria]|uniref:uncharacterized protein isoform X2 n=1 Tax=Dalotia coriaria TaxID=877792 RepID=UPI0031F353F7